MNPRAERKARAYSDLPPLPAAVITRDRQVVDTTGETWSFRAAQDGGRLFQLKWSALSARENAAHLSARALRTVQLYLARKLMVTAGHKIRNDFEALGDFTRWYGRQYGEETLDWHALRFEPLVAYLQFGLTTGSKGNHFIRLRDFYVWGAFGAQLPDFDRDLALALRAVRAQGNVKGAAVRFRDITRGPLDAAEQRAITTAIREKRGLSRDRAVVMLHLELGLNPQAAVRMRTGDLTRFQVQTVTHGQSTTAVRYHLAVPRVKKRSEFRETKMRPISTDLGDLLVALSVPDRNARLLHWMSDRRPEQGIARALARFVRVANILSPRTRGLLRLSPRRLRYTLATEMARDGASRVKIAEVLDHTDLQHVKVYVEASSYVVDQLGDRFDAVFEPIVRCFRGKIVDSHTAPAFSGIPPRTIPSAAAHLPVLPVDVGGIGMCGRDVRTDGLCQLAPPLTCYPCEFFAAFRDGPHAEVLASLEHVLGEMRASADLRITKQLEDVTAALRQLIRQIETEASSQAHP